MSLEMLKSFLEHYSAKGTKANVLKPVGWIISVLIFANIYVFYINLPIWVCILFTIFSSLAILLFIFSYIYCLLTDKDALRSESFTIQKLAIEKGFVGDNIIGKLNPLSEQQKALDIVESKSSEDLEVIK